MSGSERLRVYLKKPQVWVAGLWLVALAGLAYLVGLTAWLGVVGLAFPYQLDYGEGVMLHFVREWAHGQPIYQGLEGYPYITSNYAPLTIGLAWALTPVLGFTYAAGRLWTLVALVATAAILAVWVRRATGRWLPAAAATGLFLGSPYVYHWAPLFRVDLVGLALTLGGLYAVGVATAGQRASPAQHHEVDDAGPASGAARVRGPLLWLAVGLFLAGLYTKQSFVFAPAAAIAYLFLFVDRGWALRMAAAMGVLGGGLFVAINSLTQGGFWEGLVASNVNPFLWTEFWAQVGDFVQTFAALGVLALWYLVDKFVLERSIPLRAKISPVDLYLPAALASIGLAGKAGAWENYFFEALTALVVAAALGLARLAGQSQSRLRPDGARRGWLWAVLAWTAPVVVILQVVLMWHTPRVAERYLRLTRTSNEQMVPILAAVDGPMFSEDMGLLVTNGKVLDYYSFQRSQLARAGRWDQSWELEELRSGRRALVILEQGTRYDVDHYQRFTREFVSELDRRYRHAGTVGKYELYEPDPLQHERRVAFGGELALVGWSVELPEDLGPGNAIGLTAVWQAEAAPGRDYTTFAHLVDGDGLGWAGDDHAPIGGLYPTGRWEVGEMVRDTYRLEVPPEALPGLYDLVVGWYDPSTLERLGVSGEAGEGRPAATSFRVAVIPVDREGSSPLVLVPARVRFGGTIELVGYAWRVEEDAVQLTLQWVTGHYLEQDYAVFVHLVAESGGAQVLAQGDGLPMEGRWPTSLWLPGKAVDDTHRVPLPPGLPAGSYALLVGLYDPVSGARLLLDDGGEAVRVELDVR